MRFWLRETAILDAKSFRKMNILDFTSTQSTGYAYEATSKNTKKEGRNVINQVILVGRLTKDPELRYTSEGTALASFHLAVNRNFKNQDGVVEADFVSCTVWRKLAETTANYCRKGALIGITGRIQTRKYEGQNGKTVYVTDVVADGVRFLERKPPPADRVDKTVQKEMEKVELPF